MGHRLFAYGTLRAPEVMRAVAGRGFEHTEASLPAHAAYRVLAEDFPGLVPERGGRAVGTLWWGLNERALRRLDRFEGELYVRKRVRVDVHSGRCMAWVYLLRPLCHGRLSAQPWDYGRFREDALVRYLRKQARLTARIRRKRWSDLSPASRPPSAPPGGTAEAEARSRS